MDKITCLTVSSAVPKQIVDHYDPCVFEAMFNYRISKKYGLEYNDDLESYNLKFTKRFLEVSTKDFVINSVSEFSKSCIGYIAGWVVKKLLDQKNPKINCEICRYALIHELQTHDDFIVDALIAVKNKNGFLFPSKSVSDICIYIVKKCLDII